jgi:polysaccharide deacetylase family protein (PEP-CTERM system associated)
MKNFFSVDVEEYFQVSAFESLIRHDQWESLESRVVASTLSLLALLKQHRVRALFYVLGWVADRYPDLIREIDQHGHTIGSHTYSHKLVYSQSPHEFQSDLARSINSISTITGKPVRHFRAPSFSITKRNPWALHALRREGIEFDSSVVPIRHDRYGVPGMPSQVYWIEHEDTKLVEFPVSVLKHSGLSIPCGGGGYFRIFPWWFSRCAWRTLAKRNQPIHFYIHPWEVDPSQPRIQGLGRVSRFRHYRNLSRTMDRLALMLSTFEFGEVEYPTPNLSRSLLAS